MFKRPTKIEFFKKISAFPFLVSEMFLKKFLVDGICLNVKSLAHDAMFFTDFLRNNRVYIEIIVLKGADFHNANFNIKHFFELTCLQSFFGKSLKTSHEFRRVFKFLEFEFSKKFKMPKTKLKTKSLSVQNWERS